MSRDSTDAENEASTSSCAICLDAFDPPARVRAHTPCCGARSTRSTVQFCTQCIHHVCARHQSSSMDDVPAACPRCRAAIALARDGRTIQLARATRACDVCRQPRAVRRICDACALGARVPLRYRCVGCGRSQRIPHPMWRYMRDGPSDASDATWACHGACQAFTRWRMDERDVGAVPTYDAPEAWREARARYFDELRAEMRLGAGGGGRLGRVHWSVFAHRALAAVIIVVFGVLVAVYGEFEGEFDEAEAEAEFDVGARASARVGRASARGAARVVRAFPSHGGRNITGF